MGIFRRRDREPRSRPSVAELIERERPALSADEQAAKAEWSVGLSRARGLGDHDVVREVAKHCQLPVPDAERVEELARTLVGPQRGAVDDRALGLALLAKLSS